MRWKPGVPVVSLEDRAAWLQWKKNRTLELQRERRSRLHRIDYYPSAEVFEAIKSLTYPVAGRDASSVIDGLVLKALSRPKTPELNRAETCPSTPKNLPQRTSGPPWKG